MNFIVVLFAGIALVSCTKDSADAGKFYLDYGVIVGNKPDFKIKLDINSFF